MKRFDALYPRDSEDEVGEVVPREAVDPENEFSVESTEYLIQKFLISLDYSSNIFLSSPNEMLEEDEDGKSFQGTPYAFDIEIDRKSRQKKGLGSQ